MGMCVDTRVIVCVDMCTDMRIGMCIDICIDMCIDMHIDMCTDMCIGMCIDRPAAGVEVERRRCVWARVRTCARNMCADMCVGRPGAAGMEVERRGPHHRRSYPHCDYRCLHADIRGVSAHARRMSECWDARVYARPCTGARTCLGACL